MLGLFAELEKAEMPVKPWERNPDVEAASANELYRAIMDNTLAHDHNPLVAEHMQNLSVRTAVDGSLRLTRPDGGDPVDAALAARAAWWRAGQLADQIPTQPIRIF